MALFYFAGAGGSAVAQALVLLSEDLYSVGKYVAATACGGSIESRWISQIWKNGWLGSCAKRMVMDGTQCMKYNREVFLKRGLLGRDTIKANST